MYRALAGGVSLGEAVTAAKREGIRRGEPPAAWADVVLLGEAGVHPRARETAAVVPLVMAGLFLAIVGVGAGRWRSRRQRKQGS
jgi:hypothetical protein